MRFVWFIVILFLLAPSLVHAQELKSADEYSQRGMARFEKDDLDGAIVDFTKVIEMNGPNQEFCYYFRGMAHYRKGNLDQAVADLNKAIALKSHPRFYEDRGNLLAKQGELDRALADLNKAVELASKNARAYGHRGVVRLMRGEDALAEEDFKKCFELDRTLEPQFKAAAAQIKQRNILRYAHERPADLQVVKFSWSEETSTVLLPSSPSIPTTTTAVSPSGTRILADPKAGDQPGPTQVPDLYASGVRENRTPGTKSRNFLQYKFNASIKNVGNKTIQSIMWGYVFDPNDPAQNPTAYVFTTKTTIEPGKEKNISDSVPATTDQPWRTKSAANSTRKTFNERIVILSVDYADGTKWQSSATSEKSITPSDPRR